MSSILTAPSCAPTTTFWPPWVTGLKEIQGQQHRLFCEPALVNRSEYADFWRRLNAGEFFRGQFKRLGKHGRVIWLEASYNPVDDATGRLYKVVKYASDISERVEKHASDGRSASRAYHISAETKKIAGHGTQIIQAAASDQSIRRGDRPVGSAFRADHHHRQHH